VPIEYWLILAGTATVALICGAWLGRRSTAGEEPGSTVAAATIAQAPTVTAAAPGSIAGVPIPADLDALLVPADQIGIGLIRVDRQGTITISNRLATEMLGWRLRGLVGRTLLETFLDHNVENLVARARQQGHASIEHVMSGEPQRTLVVHAWPSADGELWIGVVDVSELSRLRRIRTEFVDNLSHELRTPLSTVRLLTESLSLESERMELPARARDSIAKIDVETGHIVQMVNELLDLAKIEQGDTPLRHDAVDMVQVAEDAASRLRIYAERQGVELKTDIPADLDATIVGDQDRLDQVLANLVHNAIKFSPSGSEVVVHVRRGASDVLVEVEDHGPGIARADHLRIFERFYKVDRARSRGRGGTGLGLAIARHIVERHQGRIWVESEEGNGSCFFVRLPSAHPVPVNGPVTEQPVKSNASVTLR